MFLGFWLYIFYNSTSTSVSLISFPFITLTVLLIWKIKSNGTARTQRMLTCKLNMNNKEEQTCQSKNNKGVQCGVGTQKILVVYLIACIVVFLMELLSVMIKF